MHTPFLILSAAYNALHGDFIGAEITYCIS